MTATFSFLLLNIFNVVHLFLALRTINCLSIKADLSPHIILGVGQVQALLFYNVWAECAPEDTKGIAKSLNYGR